ncbi:MAG: hypothetical protein M1837_003476 [Sclerophora amabilis]|nr:MAG: hypothetical protein M1837_003476 [Sclerophora amabilis]
MEVFMRAIPDQTSEDQLKRFLQPHLAKIAIHQFSCQKLRGRGCATLTVQKAEQGHNFLRQYGNPRIGGLNLKGQTILCSISRKQPDPYLLRVLMEEEEKLRNKPKVVRKSTVPSQRNFDLWKLSCGVWDYEGHDLVFVSYYEDLIQGTASFGKNSLAMVFNRCEDNSSRLRVDVPYSSVYSITLGGGTDLALTLTLTEAPRMYGYTAISQMSGLTHRLQSLGSDNRQPRFDRIRLSSISPGHKAIVSTCLVYRIQLKDSSFTHVRGLLKTRDLPPSIPWSTMVTGPKTSFTSSLSKLNQELSSKYDKLPFGVKFQVQKLAQNGYLPPARVSALLPEIARMAQSTEVDVAINAVRKLTSQIPYAGPDADAQSFTIQALANLLKRNVELCQTETFHSIVTPDQQSHLALVYKASVTPTGIYLYGPQQEPKNRVLRKYSDHLDYFLRVQFCDEDGESLHYDRFASNENIFHDRFKKILDGVINIAGRGYEFLGFSHSSLRSQTCWFMAPYVEHGNLLHARVVIARLGDFSAIRSPAKCAARIGQAFSESYSSANLSQDVMQVIPDVERFDRVFSDGVGVISSSILRRMWDENPQTLKRRPTVFQIRYAGAKGMISLDDRLKGDALLLRPSMIKFSGSSATDIEICGAASRPLPMFLNRQLIKIMEDLGVSRPTLVDLQNEAVEQLRITTLSPINASNFLHRNRIGTTAHLPWFIKKLHRMGLAFQIDPFLRDSLEMAVLVRLRELKHRARIPVEKGVTLYGIMDETAFLQEGEIYCVFETESGEKSVLTGSKVLVTRSPALHPGDLQLAKAVDVPYGSPLNALNNCVVFSQMGKRDLPSQLSGGDLDGDLYNVIWHPELCPNVTSEPADYARVQPQDIVPVVERHHMTDHFIQFMENDQLGRIANLHLILADQRPSGTFDVDCIRLAAKHSTAVDFSKTGIAVNLSDLPKYSPYKPDFMAPGPHVITENRVSLENQELSDDGEEQDAVNALDREKKSVRYYQSHKVLGELYRAIDEKSVFEGLQRQSNHLGGSSDPHQSLMEKIWNHIQHETAFIQWKHLEQEARDIKESYEDCLIETMAQYSPHPLNYLTELEVFVGNIMGKFGAQSRRQREYSIGMKDKFDRDVALIISWILKNAETGEHDAESLERSIACLAIAMEDEKSRAKIGRLRSFRYVAAAVCLKELDRAHGQIS